MLTALLSLMLYKSVIDARIKDTEECSRAAFFKLFWEELIAFLLEHLAFHHSF